MAGRGDASDVFAVLFGVFLQKVVREGHDVGLALAQRRNEDGENVQAIIEVFAEASLGDRLFEILIRGRNQAHVDFDGLGAPQSLEFPRLNDPEQLDLRGQVQIAHFVEEQRASFRQSRAVPVLRACAPVKAPFS